MELFRPKQWDTRKGRAKFADKQLYKFRKKVEKSKVLKPAEKTNQLNILKKCKKKIVKILEIPLQDKIPSPRNLLLFQFPCL